MLRVHAGGQWLTLENITKGEIPTNLDTQDTQALLVIQRWMDGTTEFTFHTSGSTGAPKRMTFRREQLEASSRLSVQALRLKQGHTALVCLDANFVAGTMMIIRSLVTGMNMVIRKPSSNPMNNIHDAIDFAAFVPLQVATMLRDAPQALDQVHTAIVGGAALSADLIASLQLRPTAFYATYGMTETLTHIGLQKVNGAGKEDSFHVLDGIKISSDHRGCLVIQAPHLDHPVVTKDRVELIGEDSFIVLGRIDEVINSGGIKIHPEKVEPIIQSTLHALGIDTRFFVAGLPDELSGECVTLVMEGNRLTARDEQKIVTALADRLSRFELPRQIRYALQFSQTATQKIDRRLTVKMLEGK